MKNEPDFTRKLINSFEKAAEQKVISKGQFLIKEGEVEKTCILLYQVPYVFSISRSLKNKPYALGMKGLLLIRFHHFLKAHLLSFTYRPSAKQLLKSFQMKSCKLL